MVLVKIGNFKLNPPIGIKKGFLQGDPLSSVLFNLFLADFEEVMKQTQAPKISLKYSQKELNYLQFADDVALIADNRLYLQKLLTHMQNYANLNLLKINERKTKIMIFRRGGNINNVKEVFFINNKRLEVVKMYKYLEVKFHALGRFHETAKEMVTKAKQKSDAIWPLLLKPNIPKFS